MNKFFQVIFKSLLSHKETKNNKREKAEDSFILEAIREKQIEDKVNNENFNLQEISIDNPINGEILNISQVPDEAFASKALGDGFAIYPHDNKVYSPIDGVVKVLFPTKHAIAIRNEHGLEILVHIGIDTVSLNGEGFQAFVSQGEKVKKHQLLLSFDKEIIENKAKSLISPVIFVATEKIKEINIYYGNKEENTETALIKIAN